jgi:glycyl-tRNA synthetase
VEVPTALRGSFDSKYLELPSEILVSVMKKHQRYLPVFGSSGTDRAGQLLPHFIAVRNGDRESLPIVRLGNEDVIRARFADASFFYSNDVRQHLGCFVPRLSTLTFQEKLGSVLDKVRRLERLAPLLGEMISLSPAELMTVRRAANLCKADLATQMVIEMTSLQGMMGREYARRSGEPAAVADAILEHYLPRSSGDALPSSRPGIVLGLADRLDSLIGLFAVGLKPSGTRDPFALRRAASGIVQVLVEKQVHLDLRAAIQQAAQQLPVPTDEAAQADVLEYIAQRQRGMLLDQGLRHDVIDAVLARRQHDPFLAERTVQRLSDWVRREDWMDLLNAFARCVRIVRDQPTRYQVRPDQLAQPAAIALYEALSRAEASIPKPPTTNQVLEAIQTLVPAINAFFDQVLVMDPDPAVRENHLGLVQEIASLTEEIADLSRLEGF